MHATITTNYTVTTGNHRPPQFPWSGNVGKGCERWNLPERTTSNVTEEKKQGSYNF